MAVLVTACLDCIQESILSTTIIGEDTIVQMEEMTSLFAITSLKQARWQVFSKDCSKKVIWTLTHHIILKKNGKILMYHLDLQLIWALALRYR